ncbi:MAG: GHKL domain-containing protein [Clostridia bacterium]|nr:GHKL domain-containing protein [Clostridia bacterium]
MPLINLASVNYILTFITVIFFIVFITITKGRNYSKSTVILFTLAVSVINSAFVTIFMYTKYDFLRPILSLLCIILFTKLLLKLSVLDSIIYSVIFYLIAMFGNVIAIITLTLAKVENLWDKNNFSVIIYANVITYVIYLLSFFIIQHFKLISKLSDDTKYRTYISSIVTIISIFVVLEINMNYYSSIIKSDPKSILFIFITLGVFMLFIYTHLGTKSKLEIKNQEYEYQIFYNKTMETLINDLRRYKHNYNNIVASLVSLVNSGQYDELQNYLKNEVESFHERNILNNSMLLRIKNAGLLGLMLYKIEKAEASDVKVSLEIFEDINEIHMNINDLCESLGILLDNAIEAASESDHKEVKVKVKNDEGHITFSIINTFKTAPDMTRIFKLDYSSKGEGHGWGLWYVKQKVLKKYKNIFLNTAIVDHAKFKQDLVISSTQRKISV